MTLDQARAVVDGVLTEARRRGARPLAVVALDAGGHLVAALREDGASLFRFDIARAKATGALGMGVDTADLAERAAGNPVFFTSLAVVAQGGLALSAGGVLLRGAAGDLIGAVGVSGDTADVDEACARAGWTAAGLNQGTSP